MLFFDFESTAKSILQQAVWILVIVCVVVAIVGYATQGIGSALGKLFGAFGIIFLLVALLKGKEIGEWLVKNLITLSMICPPNPVLGAIINGIQLYT
jgi:uncharacterized membrane protein YkvI